MTKSILLLIISLSFISSMKATIITVDNNYPSIGDYTTLQPAHDAASNGDTLYVYPSVVCYDAISLTKQLVIIGAGWESPQAGIKTTAICDTMVFLAGSDGSVIEGFGGNFVINIKTNSIQVRRNLLRSIYIFSNTQSIYISQNYFQIVNGQNDERNLNIEEFTEVYVSNNIFCNHGYANHGIIAESGNSTLSILNNVLHIHSGYAIILTNSNHYLANNIVIGQVYGIEENACFYNMSNYDQFPDYNGNIINVDMETVFVDYWGCDFHLIPGSPAIGTGLNGTDMGIYGSDFPFVDGGYPGIPVIYYLDVPANGSQQDGLEVEIKVRSNN